MKKRNVTVDKIIVAVLFIGFAFFILVSTSGCTTQPMPNINIGSAEGCAPAELNLTIITNNDKAYLGDDGNINDDDGGQTPSLGLQK